MRKKYKPSVTTKESAGSSEDSFFEDLSDTCALCNDLRSGEVIDLRDGWVHKLCVNELESKTSSIENQILLLETRLKEGPFSKIKNFFRGTYLSGESVNAKIKQLKEEMAPFKLKLQNLYDYYWERPPDWEERSFQIKMKYNWTCQHCNKYMLRSKVPIHIHHIIPSAMLEGNHKLDNLLLLCEICHSKMPGHNFTKAIRKRRLKRRKGRRRS